jgi:hypothetical protein
MLEGYIPITWTQQQIQPDAPSTLLAQDQVIPALPFLVFSLLNLIEKGHMKETKESTGCLASCIGHLQLLLVPCLPLWVSANILKSFLFKKTMHKDIYLKKNWSIVRSTQGPWYRKATNYRYATIATNKFTASSSDHRHLLIHLSAGVPRREHPAYYKGWFQEIMGTTAWNTAGDNAVAQ